MCRETAHRCERPTPLHSCTDCARNNCATLASRRIGFFNPVSGLQTRFTLPPVEPSAAPLRASEPPLREVIRESLEFAAAQYTRLLAQIQGREGFPRTFEKDEIKMVSPDDWTSGFFPGALWHLFAATGDETWRAAAKTYTLRLEQEKNNRGTHDLGFMLYCSYGNALRLAPEPGYRDVLLAAAESLSARFNPKVGCIQSWPTGKSGWQFPVIIDNVVNLELLTWAARASGEEKYRAIALAHADTTLAHHFRPDGSSVHVVDYEPETGAVKTTQTYQGMADGSSWSRGQAWGLYGYTMMFRETKQPAYLAQAGKIAAFLTTHPRLPTDKVPYWDFDAPDIPHAPRDASAAALMSSALFELSSLVEADTGRHYHEFAVQQLRSLASPAYRAPPGANGNFLLMHATGHLPAQREVDVPLNYADYYFLEALLRAEASLVKAG